MVVGFDRSESERLAGGRSETVDAFDIMQRFIEPLSMHLLTTGPCGISSDQVSSRWQNICAAFISGKKILRSLSHFPESRQLTGKVSFLPPTEEIATKADSLATLGKSEHL